MAKLRAQVGVNHVGIDLYLERKICASPKPVIREWILKKYQIFDGVVFFFFNCLTLEIFIYLKYKI